MEFRCFNGMNNCDYCCSCHSEFKVRTSDEKRRIYNQALEDISEKMKWQYKNYKSMPSIHLFLEIVEQLKK